MATLSKKSGLPSNVTMGVYEGTLNLYRKGALRKIKKYYTTLIAPSQSGLARLEFYENEKHSLSLEPIFMVLGSEVVKVERITLKEKEMRNAFLYIQKTLLEKVHVPGDTILKENTAGISVNEIYESIGNVPCQKTEFMVGSDQTTQARLGVCGNIKLVVEDESICLITPSMKMIVRWNFKEIRKFIVAQNMFSLEAGRKSSLGEGTFTFLTEEAETIRRMVDLKKEALKEKMRKTSFHPKPNTLPPPVQSHAFPQPSAQYAPRTENINTCKDTTYNSHEELMMMSYNAKRKPCTAGNVCHQQLVRPKQDGHYLTGRPIVPTRSGWSSSNSQGINSSAENDTEHVIDQGQIYSEPEIIRNAWEHHGYNDDAGDSDMYSNLEFTLKQKEAGDENHYWSGETANAPGNIRQDTQDNVKEDIYAVVDYSMKKKKK
ncbi:docking protein 1-like isoform X2 [Portunus trituberculatus]|uniref:docking protein 1-like isoform X2 n=1 Tax=Portunus trituberculatus TaxID=210409 RepID=UPI001E1CC02A|nr:docking protein 1-like isoform X2 [Portunus trituberculatus]